jgi:hypothetical protein
MARGCASWKGHRLLGPTGDSAPAVNSRNGRLARPDPKEVRILPPDKEDGIPLTSSERPPTESRKAESRLSHATIQFQRANVKGTRGLSAHEWIADSVRHDGATNDTQTYRAAWRGNAVSLNLTSRNQIDDWLKRVHARRCVA